MTEATGHEIRESARRLTCAQCGAMFDCDPGGDCWCMAEPYRLPMTGDAGGDCLCRSCLRKAAGDKPGPARL